MPSRLKSLELQGYKTFANRTVFEYAGTITAIVGPNGSGKSNIADSIRWVLGEQSYSVLRGKKTEDMIFSGSEQRPRAGMASATMVFDNSDGWLPIDYSEVAVTRRAYRDGQNEYLINGARVRLKDVSELLAQSGLAERTYTVIGQGLVDAALALKAEERRRLFEEAAGIGLYRSRREEALRRLDSTRRNLERAQDILAELTPRLRSLERQARRAEEYEQVRSDLRVLMREWYGYHWHRAQVELAEAKKLTLARQQTQEKERQVQDQIDGQLSTLRGRIQSLRGQLNEWHHALSQLHARREELSRERAAVEERSRWQEQQEHSSHEEIARLMEELELGREMVNLADGEAAKLEAEILTAQAELQQAQAALAERLAERKRLEDELKAAQAAFQQLSDRRAELAARQEQSHSQVERLGENLASMDAELATLERTISQARQAVQRAADEVLKAEAEQKRLEERLTNQRQHIADQESTRQGLEKQRAGVQTELSRLSASLQVLQQAESSLSGYAEGARLVLKAAQRKSLRGVLGALSQVLEVPAEYENALASILGEYVDAIVLEKDGDPDRALDMLLENTSRGVLLPLDSLKAKPALRLPDRLPGCIGLASALVETSPEYRPIVELLLGRAVVVEDRRAARQMLTRLSDDAQVVTLKGEIFHASGAIQAGREAGLSTLNRRKQMATLQSSLEKAQAQAHALDEQLASLDISLQEGRRAEDSLVSAVQENRTRLETVRSGQRQAQLEADKAENMRGLQLEQRAQVEQEVERLREALLGARQESATLESEIHVAQDSLHALNAQLSAETLQEFNQQVNHWNASLLVLQRAASDAQNRRNERLAALHKSQESLAAAQSRLDEAGRARQTLAARLAELKTAEIEVSQGIAQQNEMIAPAEAELRGVENELLDFQEKEVAARSQISAAEQLTTQARIAQTRQQERLEALQRRIEDDFGLVAFEYAEDVSGRTPLPLSGLVERLPRVESISPELENMINEAKAQMRRMGAINMEAKVEYEEVKQRHAFMTAQIADMEQAEQDIRQVIAELDDIMQQEFQRTFQAVHEEFKQIFTQLFGGGSARLVLTDPEDLTGTGIDIEARLPGKRVQGLSLLSGGERSLTAAALIFALLRVSPTPFCVLDEVDAMLDEANVGRFSELLQELSEKTQFIIVTHNRNTVQVADVLYGVTMGRDSTSQVISLKLDDLDKVLRN